MPRVKIDYNKTKRGFLVNKYAGMKYRVNSDKKKYYFNLPIASKEAFYAWSFNSKTFHELWDLWVESGYDRRFTPSVDRIVPCAGYVINNMEWVSFSKNCSRAHKSSLNS